MIRHISIKKAIEEYQGMNKLLGAIGCFVVAMLAMFIGRDSATGSILIGLQFVCLAMPDNK